MIISKLACIKTSKKNIKSRIHYIESYSFIQDVILNVLRTSPFLMRRIRFALKNVQDALLMEQSIRLGRKYQLKYHAISGITEQYFYNIYLCLKMHLGLNISIIYLCIFSVIVMKMDLKYVSSDLVSTFCNILNKLDIATTYYKDMRTYLNVSSSLCSYEFIFMCFTTKSKRLNVLIRLFTDIKLLI